MVPSGELLTAIAPGTHADGAATAWLGDGGTRAWAVGRAGILRVLELPGPVLALHQQGERLAVAGGAAAWLIDRWV